MSEGWVGVASLDHVRAAIEGGFCQLDHGKPAPLQRLHSGNTIIYYAPQEQMRAGKVVQAFVALGRILSREPWKVDASGGFAPFRRAVNYFDGNDAPIRPLLPILSFTRDRTSWGHSFRRGTFQIAHGVVCAIAAAMGIEIPN